MTPSSNVGTPPVPASVAISGVITLPISLILSDQSAVPDMTSLHEKNFIGHFTIIVYVHYLFLFIGRG